MPGTDVKLPAEALSPALSPAGDCAVLHCIDEGATKMHNALTVHCVVHQDHAKVRPRQKCWPKSVLRFFSTTNLKTNKWSWNRVHSTVAILL